jgi:hypothetical protein
MVDAFAFDEREWMRDELLIAADEWAEIMAGAEAQQAHDIRNLLFAVMHSCSSPVPPCVSVGQRDGC